MSRPLHNLGMRLRRYERIRVAGRRLRRRWKARNNDQLRAWDERAEHQWANEPRSYLDLPLDAARHPYGGKTAFLYGVCLALRPPIIVELGSGFSWYDMGLPYERAINVLDEALSTRVLLAAARLLSQTGTASHVHSIDLRNPEDLEPRLAEDFGLSGFLTYSLGQDAVEWLRSFDGEIGVLFTDSHHTRQQILAELETVEPKMAARAAPRSTEGESTEPSSSGALPTRTGTRRGRGMTSSC